MAKMSDGDQHRLIGQILDDDGFRKALLHDPAQALRDNGYPVDYAVIDAIKATDPATLDLVVRHFGEGRKGAHGGGGPCA